MNDTNDAFLFKLLLIAGVGFAAYQLIMTVIAAIAALLHLLIIIAGSAAAIVAFCYVYRRHIAPTIANQDYKTHHVNEIEAQRKRTIKATPRHIREDANTYHKERQRDVYNPNPPSKFDQAVDAAKQVVSLYRFKQ